MTDELVQRSVRNNAAWCDTVCRTHGRPGEFFDQIWISRLATPRFYPNAVTLTDAGAAEQLRHIRELAAAQIPGEWGVKDSFCALDLAPMGFHVLFDAHWFGGSPALPRAGDRIPDTRWARIESASALADWESAWGGDASAQPAHVFLPALLAEPDVAVIAGYQGQRIVAGAIGNRAADVVGLSNLFVPANDPGRFGAGCASAMIAAFPGLPVVGYASGPELAAAIALGFQRLGPLRIWATRNDATPSGTMRPR